MIFCITFLRALAAMIITNSHYTGVYPTDLIANGGLLGDVIFFAVSGFCLYDVKMSFGKWYLRRIVRVYPAPIIITAVYMLLGLYNSFEGIRGFFEWFIYPTNYHFVASIIVLYIPFYVVVSVKQLREKISLVFVGVVIIHIIVYVFMYDKSYYHIDTVREPMIRFLFFEAMLIGAYFKNVFDKERDNFKILGGVVSIVLLLVYFASKMLFSKVDVISEYQIINQFVLLVLLYFIMKCFIGIDSKLEKLPGRIKVIFNYLSEITLEIYVVQYAIIPKLAKISIFPINWIVITFTILAAASVLHLSVKLVNQQTDKLFIKEK